MVREIPRLGRVLPEISSASRRFQTGSVRRRRRNHGRLRQGRALEVEEWPGPRDGFEGERWIPVLAHMRANDVAGTSVNWKSAISGSLVLRKGFGTARVHLMVNYLAGKCLPVAEFGAKEREHVRIELFVEGDAVKAWRIRADFSHVLLRFGRAGNQTLAAGGTDRPPQAGRAREQEGEMGWSSARRGTRGLPAGLRPRRQRFQPRASAFLPNGSHVPTPTAEPVS